MIRTPVCPTSLALALLLGLVGCGGGGGAPKETPKTPTPPTTVAAAPTAAGGPTTTTVAGAGEEEAAPLLAWADANPEEGDAPLAVEFTADIEGGTPPLKYLWKFGDGSPDSTEQNPKHTYAKAGTYRADLEVKDSGGDEDADYIDVEVHEAGLGGGEKK